MVISYEMTMSVIFCLSYDLSKELFIAFKVDTISTKNALLIRQTDLFHEKCKKIGPKINLFFGRVPELKYSRSFKMVTKLHNRSKQSHFPAHLHQLSLCLLSIIGQLSIIQRLSIDKDRYSLVSSH